MRHAALHLVLALIPAAALAQSAPAVKKSEQGICHERGTGTYKRTKHFEPYDSMQACLASGGRLARNAATDEAEAGETRSSGEGWVSNIGAKIAVIIGILVIVGGAFFVSRRRRAIAGHGINQDELERKRWEGNRRE